MATYRGVPALRASPFEADAHDGQRIAYATRLWHGQDELLRRRDRQVEENIRMLCGQHWSVYNQFLQKFIDVTEWMTDDERRWRQRPVINRVLYWYMMTTARLTENPPIITFQPSNGDRFSADLAEVADTIFKTKWRDISMGDVVDRLVAWMTPGGRAHLMSVVDPRLGDLVTNRGPGVLSLLDPQSGEPVLGEDGGPIQRVLPNIPYDRDGNPNARLLHDGQGGGQLEAGDPYSEHEGGLRVDVLSCLQVRGQWGPNPWHEKSWHAVRTFLTPEECWELFGVDCEPTSTIDGASDPGYLQRMLFGTGFFGAAAARPGAEFTTSPSKEGYVDVFSIWQRPCGFEGMEETDEKPGGRLLIVTPDKCLRDGQRPFAFESASSIRTFDFVTVPGRPSGTSPQEMLNPINRAENRQVAQILEHSNLVSNPIAIIDQDSGLGSIEFVNKPGAQYEARRKPGVTPLEFVQPPSLGRDVYNAQAMMGGYIEKLGNIEGAEGRPPTTDPSGKLIKELRYNSDRFLGPTARRMVEELARMGDDWLVIHKVIWPEEKVIEYAGLDTVPRTINVYPELFTKGKVHALADIESMLPESRSERIGRVNEMYEMGAFGPPGTPAATMKWLEMARFPHMSRTAWPAGIHVVTAQQENGQMVRGTPADQIPVFEWYDHATHLNIHETYMAAPEYLRLPREVQAAFVFHRMMHQQAMMAGAIKALQQQSLLGSLGAPPPGDPGAAGAGPGAGPKRSPRGNSGGEAPGGGNPRNIGVA